MGAMRLVNILVLGALTAPACSYEYRGDKCAPAGDDNDTMETATDLGQMYPEHDVVRVERPVANADEQDWFSVDLQSNGEDFDGSITVQLETDPFSAGGDIEVVVSCTAPGRLTTLRCDGVLEEAEGMTGTCNAISSSLRVGFVCEHTPGGDPIFVERAFVHVSNVGLSECAGYALEIDLD